MAIDFQEMKNTVIEMQTTAFNRAHNYTTVVLFGGYAGLFATWNFTRSDISPVAAYCVGLLGGISLLSFVVYEVFMMIKRARHFLAFQALLKEELPDNEFLERIKELEATERQRLFRHEVPIWAVSIFISIVAGLGAASILLYTFACTLANEYL